jgi:BirA family biotin operon repressor/biotin-[acetyl-CoA-carboxylase] ligase
MSFHRIHHGVVDSTSERAFDSLRRGEARDGDVHVALGQTQGRGRLGRPWHSAPGEGLYASLVHLAPAPGPQPAALPMAAALALTDALDPELAARGLERIELDWPNDLVAAGAKLAGILVETRGLDPARPHFVIGIGVNVAQRAFPPELLAERPATSLALLGLETTPDHVLDLLLPQLEARLSQARADPESLGHDYLTRTGMAGERVRVELADATFTGVLRSLSPTRGLELQTPDGMRELPLGHVRVLART